MASNSSLNRTVISKDDDDRAKEVPRDATVESIPLHPLGRNLAVGLNPTSLITGYYGSRGERIRTIVHEGALHLSEDALEIILEQGEKRKTVKEIFEVSKKADYVLPGLDSVTRPSLDGSKTSITVTRVFALETTEVRGSDLPRDGEDEGESSRRKTKCRNQVVNVVSGDNPGDLVRIRGGGDEVFDSQPTENFDAAPPQMGSTTAASIPQEGDPLNTGEMTTMSLPNMDVAEAPPSVQPPERASSQVEAPIPTMSPISPPVLTAPPSVSDAPQQPPTSSAPSLLPPVAATVIDLEAPQPVASTSPAGVSSSLSGEPFAKPIDSMASTPDTKTASTGSTSIVKSADTPLSGGKISAAEQASISSQPQVLSLKKRPAPQWEQHAPGPNDEVQIDQTSRTPKPEWYEAASVSELEKSVLPEWFDGSAPHRTPQSYIAAREKVLEMSEKLANRYVTGTMVRRAIPGDAGSLIRLHSFLTTYSLINEDAINDSAPTPLALQPEEKSTKKVVWNELLHLRLVTAVVEQSRKRPKLDHPSEASSQFDWDAIAATVGLGVSAVECERQFLAVPVEHAFKNERSITPDSMSIAGDAIGKEASSNLDEATRLLLKQEVLHDILEKTPDHIIRAVTDAALRSTTEPSEVQNAALVGIASSQAIQQARSHENAVSRVLSEIVDLRMKKLENRMALLDDIEGLLEAERVALELERRDLYTARCRHWFGGT